MNLEDIRLFCLSMEGTTEDMPWGDDILLFRVENKIFAAMSLDAENMHITVKCNPEKAVLQREQYRAVEPAFHWNKKYWNDLYFGRDLSDEGIRKCIVDSYREVIAKLPKKLREKYPDIERS